jgi:hypothetical protein
MENLNGKGGKTKDKRVIEVKRVNFGISQEGG